MTVEKQTQRFKYFRVLNVIFTHFSGGKTSKSNMSAYNSLKFDNVVEN